MRLKTRIVSTVMSMALALGVMTFAVYAAATQTLSITNTVSFVSDHVLVHVTGQVEGAKAWEGGAVNMTYGKVTTNPTVNLNELDNWEIGHIDFEKENAPINIFILIENYSLERMFTFELEFNMVNDVEDTNINREVNYFNGYDAEYDLEDYIIDYDSESEDVVLQSYGNGQVPVQPSTAKIIVVTLEIADTGLSVNSFDNAFSITLLNEGEATEQPGGGDEEPGGEEPGEGNFVYNPQNNIITIPQQQTIDYKTIPDTTTSGNLAFYGLYTDPLFQSKIILPFTNETQNPTPVYAKTGSLPSGLDLMLSPSMESYSVMGYTGSEEYLVVPEIYENMLVREIEAYAFQNNSTIKHIDISSIEMIGWGAFSNATNLEAVISPNVYFVNDLAFEYTNSLTTLSFPKMEYIGSGNGQFGAFENATGLTSISLPNATELGPRTFKNTLSLLTLDLPKVTKVGRNAFEGPDFNPMYEVWDDETNTFIYTGPISQLHTVNLPVVERIDDYAFSGAVSVETLTTPDFVSIGVNAMPQGVLDYVDIKDQSDQTVGALVFYKDILVSAMISSLQDITIPNGTIAIADGVFEQMWGDNYLQTVSLPESLYHIGVSAFAGNNALHTINLQNATYIGNEAFKNTNLQTVNLTSAIIIGESAFEATNPSLFNSITTVIGGANLQSVGYAAFANNQAWQVENDYVVLGGTYLLGYNGVAPSVVVVPTGVTVIGDYAFAQQSSITSIQLPNTVIAINDGAFNSCSNLVSASMQSVLRIGNSAFGGARLTSLDLPNATEIGVFAFDRNNLSNISIPSVVTLGVGAFWENIPLQEIVLPETLVSAEYVFMFCENLQTITLNSTVYNLDMLHGIFETSAQQTITYYIIEGLNIQQSDFYAFLMPRYTIVESDIAGYIKLVG